MTTIRDIMAEPMAEPADTPAGAPQAVPWTARIAGALRRQVPRAIEQFGAGWDTLNALNNMQTAVAPAPTVEDTMGLGDFAGLSMPDPARREMFSQGHAQLMNAAPVPPEVQYIGEAESYGDAFSRIGENPEALVPLIARSMGSQAPHLAWGGIGGGVTSMMPGLLAKAATAAGVSGGSAFTAEKYLSFLEGLQRQGVDTNDEQAMWEAMNNPQIVDAANEYATNRAAAVGAAGAVQGPLAMTTRGVLPKLATIPLEAGGERLAQAAVGEHKPGEVLLEAAAGAGTTVPEVAGSALMGRQQGVAPAEVDLILDDVLGATPETDQPAPPRELALQGFDTAPAATPEQAASAQEALRRLEGQPPAPVANVDPGAVQVAPGVPAAEIDTIVDQALGLETAPQVGLETAPQVGLETAPQVAAETAPTVGPPVVPAAPTPPQAAPVPGQPETTLQRAPQAPAAPVPPVPSQAPAPQVAPTPEAIPDAQNLRGDQGPPAQAGRAPGPGQDISGQNLQQQAPVEPQPAQTQPAAQATPVVRTELVRETPERTVPENPPAAGPPAAGPPAAGPPAAGVVDNTKSGWAKPVVAGVRNAVEKGSLIANVTIEDSAPANDPNAEAVYKDGKVTIYADNVKSKKRALQLVDHEVVVHHGLRRWAESVGADLNTTLQEIYRSRQADVDRFRAQREDPDDPWSGIEEATEEWVAVEAEKAAKTGVISDALKKVIRAIKNALQARDGSTWSNREILDLIAKGRRAMQTPGTVTDTAERHSRKPQLKGFAKVMDQVPGIKALVPYLTPMERDKQNAGTAAKLVGLVNDMPDPGEMASVAYSGRAKRGWYKRSADALIEIFGLHDAPRFTALLAATSPQTSVESNLINALKIWTAWVSEDRPLDEASIRRIMAENVEGSGTEKSVLDAWVKNALTALQTEDPLGITLSGPKVNSFMLNLMHVTQEVTNDAWMANYALMDQKIFSGQRGTTPGTRDPGKTPGYLAMSATVRKAAEILSRRTGETWTPAEIQETVWSWAKTLYEKAMDQDETRSIQEILAAGDLTHEEIGVTPDFELLFLENIYRKVLELGGYEQQVKDLEAKVRRESGTGSGEIVHRHDFRGSATGAEGAGISARAFQADLNRAGKRLTELKRRRLEEKAWRSNYSVTMEVVPGASVGLKTDWLNNAPLNVRRKYTREMLKVINSSKAGDDILRKLGLIGSIRAELGSWEGAVNPNVVVNIIARGSPEKAAEAATAYATVFGEIFRQDGAAWHRADTKAKKGDAPLDGFAVMFNKPPTDDMVEELYTHIRKYHPTAELTRVGNGVRVINFDDTVDTKSFNARMVDAYDNIDVQSPTSHRLVRGVHFRAEGALIENDWETQNNGEGYANRRGTAGGPGLRRWIQDRRNVAAEIHDKLEKKFAGSEDNSPGGEGTDVRHSRLRTRPDGKVNLRHWSRQRRTTLDPEYHGTGIKGAEAKRKQADPDNYLPRIYYGLDEYKPEPGLGSSEHVVGGDPEKIYDFAGDPDKIREKVKPTGWDNPISLYEKAISDAGYDGYYVGDVAAMFTSQTPD